jgi:hypothetical protein
MATIHQWEGSRRFPDLDLAFVCQCLAQDAPLNASLLFAERYQAVH